MTKIDTILKSLISPPASFYGARFSYQVHLLLVVTKRFRPPFDIFLSVTQCYFSASDHFPWSQAIFLLSRILIMTKSALEVNIWKREGTHKTLKMARLTHLSKGMKAQKLFFTSSCACAKGQQQPFLLLFK